jgi:hypothetical protein
LPGLERAAALWAEWQCGVVDAVCRFILFQPNCQIAARNSLAALPFRAVGWQLEVGRVRPA